MAVLLCIMVSKGNSSSVKENDKMSSPTPSVYIALNAIRSPYPEIYLCARTQIVQKCDTSRHRY